MELRGLLYLRHPPSKGPATENDLRMFRNVRRETYNPFFREVGSYSPEPAIVRLGPTPLNPL